MWHNVNNWYIEAMRKWVFTEQCHFNFSSDLKLFKKKKKKEKKQSLFPINKML